MSKYVGGLPTLQPKQNTFGATVQTIAQEMKAANAQKVVSNPNASPIQKAMALASLGHEKLAQEVYKKSENESFLANVQQQINQRLGRGGAPNVPGATPGINPNANANVEDFSQLQGINTPQRASREATSLEYGNTDIGPQQGAAPQNVPQEIQPQVPLAEQVQVYDEAAQTLLNKNPEASRYYQDQANQARKDMRAKEEFNKQVEVQERKANEPYRKKIVESIPQVKKLNAQLNRLETLNKKELLTPAAVKTLQLFGIPLGVFDTADEQEFEKQALDLTANIQADYGNRILQTEFNTFLRRIPTLLNSKEGRERIIENMRLYNDARQAEQDAYSDLYRIQKQSGVKYPLVTREEVLELAGPKIDKVFDRINENLMTESGTKELSKALPAAPEGTIRMTKDGKFYNIPVDQVEYRRKQGLMPV